MARSGLLLALALIGVSSGTLLASPPGEVAALAFTDKQTLSWSASPSASAYNVYRGTSADGSDARCWVFRTATTEVTDSATPGSLFTYLVSGYNVDGEGTLGSSSSGAPRVPQVRCTDNDLDGVRDDQDNCPLIANLTQADQDLDGQGDLCDPQTYHFEFDTVGLRPGGMTQDGGSNTTFNVQEFGGDRGVSYLTAGAAVVDGFDRFVSDRPRQNFDLYLDTAATPTGYAIVEFWNDGNPGERAGRALRFYVGQGVVGLQTRRGDLAVTLAEQAVSVLERLRVRVRERLGGGRDVHVDTWSGTAWNQDAAVFVVADDEPYFGRRVALTEWGGGTRGVTRVTLNGVWTGPDFALNKSFETVSDWQVVQRNAVGFADLKLALQYRASEPVRVEVAVESSATGTPLPGFDYAAHIYDFAAAPDGAYAQIVLPAVPQGGNYDVRARLVARDDAQILGSDVATQVAVGDVFLAAGQSNMSGYSGTIDPAEAPVDNVHLFGNDYRWKRAREPMDDGTDQVDRVSEEAPAHTLMLRFAKEISAAAGVPVAIVPAPLGGTNLYSQWQRNAGEPDNRGTLYGSSIHRVQVHQFSNPIRGAIWYQGESDAGRGTDLYLQDLRNLVAQWRSDLSAPDLFFGNCQLANYQDANFDTWIPIQEAQRRFALEELESSVVGLVDQPRADSIHLSVAGYKEAGRRLGLSVLAGSYGIPQVLGPKLQAVRFQSGARSRIEIVYDKPVQGGATQVFRVYEGTVQQNIVSLSVSGNIVVLQMQRNLSATNTFVTYGTSRAAGGAGWVTATDGSGAALAFYKIKVQ
ncbi:MAG: sialate O-acetylesterase [Acidobacteriota bacterium]